LQSLFSIARGERPKGELLPPCRLEAFGSVFYGEEAIVLSFRRAPLVFSEHSTVVEADGHLAIFDGETVLIADVYGSAVSRLWRLGTGRPAEAERALAVPFDPDLVQSRGDLAMRAEDHPALTPNAVPHVEMIGQSVARGWSVEDGPAPYRLRSFLLRAFTQAGSGVALFATHRLGPTAVRTIGFSYAAALFRMEGDKFGTHRVVRDRAGEAAIESRQWTPRVE
jgi:hypothetical protein